VAEQAGGAVQHSLEVANPAPGLWRLRVSSAAAHALEVSGLVSGSPREGDTGVLTVAAEDTRYPRPLAVSAELWGERPLAGAHVSGVVEAPDGSESALLLRDDGEQGDAFAGDGVYSALLEAQRNGVYTFSISAKAAAGSAYYTSLGLGLAPSEGDSGDPPPDVPLSADLQRFALAQVTVSGVGADDHGHDIATATPVVADDADVPGEIDAAGDHDFFRVAVPAGESALTFRVTEVAFGMEPQLTLWDAAGAVLLGPLQLDEGTDEYLSATLPGLAEGAVVYAEVSHVDPLGTGTYNFSAGPAIASDDLATVAVRASAGPGGLISPEGEVALAYGASQTFTFTPDAHHYVDDVLVDRVSLGPLASYTFRRLAADHTIRVSFARVLTPTPQPMPSYAISSSVLGGHGSVSPAGVTSVAYGATPTYLFTPDAGYRVDAVTVDGLPVAMTATNAYTFPGVAASHALTMSFAPIAPVPAAAFTITPLVSGGHGSVTPAGPQSVGLGAPPSRSTRRTPRASPAPGRAARAPSWSPRPQPWGPSR